jgi:uncharacterized delta-60 repeat protein
VLCATLTCSSHLATAQAGKLDPTFSTGGIFTDSSAEFDNMGTFGNVVAIQNDVKILAAGQIGFAAGMVRLNSNGTLDVGFGTGGTVTINFPGSTLGASQIIGLAIQSDGKMVAGISNANADGSPVFIVARLNPNGSPDATFGNAGVVETQIGPSGIAASVLGLQADGKILLAGPGAMVRYETTGQLDSTFGSGGMVVIPVAGPTAIALQPDGKILVAAGGSVPGVQAGPPGLQFAFPSPAGVVTRYNTNGSLDISFGISGQAASVAVPSAIAVQTNGTCASTCKIVVAGPIAAIDSVGQGGSSSLGFGLARFTSLGNVDTTFGRNGGVITTFTTSDRIAANFALVLQKNGDIVVAGTTGQSHFGVSVTQADFALAQYTANGALDTTFGSGGRVTSAFGANQAGIYALALQSDGKIVAAGSSLEASTCGQVGGLVVARYLAQ